VKKGLAMVTKNMNKILAWLWLLSGYFLDVWYQFAPGKKIINADMSAELVLADVLNQERAIISTNWYYATELRVFQIQWVYRLWLLLFPNNWNLVRTFSMATLLLILIIASLFFYKQINAGIIGVWATGFLLWPFGYWYFYYSVCDCYYLTFYIVAMLTYALVIHYSKEHKLWTLIFATCISVMMGLNGIRELMVLYVPVLVASIILFLYKAINEEKESTIIGFALENRKCIRTVIISGLMAIFAFAGYLINSKILVNHYSLEVKYDDLYWINCHTFLKDVLREYWGLFGLQATTPLFSIKGILGAGAMVLMLLIVWSFIQDLRRLQDMSIEEQLSFIIYICSMGTCSLVFVFLGNYHITYWLPLIPISVVMISLEIKNEIIRVKNLKTYLVIAISICIIACSVSTIKTYIESPNKGNSELWSVAEWMNANGYTKGVATFWIADTITEMTNGSVEMWSVWDYSSGMGYRWLQKKDHQKVPDDSYIIIIDRTEDGIDTENVYGNKQCSLVYQYETYDLYLVK